MAKNDLSTDIEEFSKIGKRQLTGINEENVRRAVELCRAIFRGVLRSASFEDRKITALLTKFVDAAGTWNDVFGASPADIVRVAGGVVADPKR